MRASAHTPRPSRPRSPNSRLPIGPSHTNWDGLHWADNRQAYFTRRLAEVWSTSWGGDEACSIGNGLCHSALIRLNARIHRKAVASNSFATGFDTTSIRLRTEKKMNRLRPIWWKSKDTYTPFRACLRLTLGVYARGQFNHFSASFNKLCRRP